jgi:hypothetical protein
MTEPLMWVGAIALLGIPLVRDLSADRMVRNQYRDLESCDCDYSAARCDWNSEASRYVGPWYAATGTKPDAADPGPGRCYLPHQRGVYFGGAGSYRPPATVEHGFRGGFGGTGRVRAAGS